MTKQIKIYSFHFNRPDFIALQKKTLDCFVKEPHELVIVNNARDASSMQEIDKQAKILGLQCIRTSATAPSHLPGLHHAQAMNETWLNHIQHEEGYAVFLDGDVVAIKDFNIHEYMENGKWIVAGPRQRRQQFYYLTPAFLILDLDQMPDKETVNWVGIHIDGVALDTGGGFYTYLRDHPNIKTKTKSMNFTWHITANNQNLHTLPEEIRKDYRDEYVWEFFTDSFLHYCRSSNWDGMPHDYHIRKTSLINKFIDGSMNGTIKPVDHDFLIKNETYFGWPEE